MENRTLPFNKYQLNNKRPCCNTNGGKQYFFANEPSGNKNDDIFSDCFKVAEEIKKKIIYEQFDAILFLYSKILKENKRKKCASKEIDEKVEEAINTTLEIYSLIESNDENTKKIYLKKIYSICDIIYKLLVEYTKNDNSKQLKEKIINHESEEKEKILKDHCKEESEHIITGGLKQISEENKAQGRTEINNDSRGNMKENYKASGIKEIKRILPSFCNNRKKKEYLYKNFSQTNKLCLYGARELDEKFIYNPYKKMKSFKFYKNIDKNLRVNKIDELIERFEKNMKDEKIKVYNFEKKIEKHTDLKKMLLKSRKSITKFELDENGNVKTVTELFQKYEKKKKKNIITFDGYNDNFIKIKKLSNLDELKKVKKKLSEKNNPVLLYSDQYKTSNTKQNKNNGLILNTNLCIDVNKKNELVENSSKDINYISPEKKIKSKTNSMMHCHNNYKNIDKSSKRKDWDKYIANLNFYMQHINGVKFVNYYDDDEIIKHILKENEEKKNKTKLDILNNKILKHNNVSLHRCGGGLYEYTNKNKINNSQKKNMDIYSELYMNRYELLSKIYNLNQNKKSEIVKYNEEKKNSKQINAFQNNQNKQMNNIKKLKKNYNDENKMCQKNCGCGNNQIFNIFLSNCFEKKRQVSEKNEKLKIMSVHKKTTKKKSEPILEKKKYQQSQPFKLESGNDKIRDTVQLESKIKYQSGNTIEIKEKEEKLNCENMHLMDKENRTYSISKIASIISKVDKSKNSIYNENEPNENKTNIKIEGFIFNEHLKDITIKSYNINNKSSKNCIKYISNNLNDNKIIDEDTEEQQTNFIVSKEAKEDSTNDESIKKEEDESIKKEEDESIKREEDESIKREEDESIKKEEDESIKREEDESIKREEDESIKKEENESIKKEDDESIKREENESIKREEDESIKKEENKGDVIKKNTSSLSSSLRKDANESDSIDLSDFMKRENSNKEDNIDDSYGSIENVSRGIQIENDKEETINNYLKSGFFAHVHIILSDTNIITRKCKIFYDNKTKKLGILRNKKIFKIDVSKLMIQEIPSSKPDLAIIKIIIPQNNCRLLIVESNDFFGLQALGDKIGWSPDINDENELEVTRKDQEDKLKKNHFLMKYFYKDM